MKQLPQTFDPQDITIARMAKAIAHPARIAILRKLVQNQACYCGDIVDEIPLAQSTVSQHIDALVKAGLLIKTGSPSKICYCLNQKNFLNLSGMLKSLLTGFQNCC